MSGHKMLPQLWELMQRIEMNTGKKLPPDEVAYLQSIKTVDDIPAYQDDGTGRFNALAYDVAIAMGLGKWDAMSVAGDH